MKPRLMSVKEARRLLLGAQALLDDPAHTAGKAALKKLISKLGFVQLDSINVVERAHHLTLWTRLHDFKKEHLDQLLSKDRFVFEHWTHDASLIPVEHYSHWKVRFRQDAERLRNHSWWNYHFRESDADQVLSHVRERIRREGPLRSSDFEHPEKRGPWWGWKPQKAALEFLWRSGELAITHRVHFHKVYDLSERVLPRHHACEEPSPEAQIAWACESAMERLLVFTPKELAAFWNAISMDEAKVWCAQALKKNQIVPVEVESADGSQPQSAFAAADWKARLAHMPEAPDAARLLCPFDPIIRDRGRCLRRFNFDYRFEAYTPEPKRTYGYYVLPILEGEHIIGRLDPKFHRDRGTLEIKGLWFEPKVRATKARMKAVENAVAALAHFVGARDYDLR
jgi:uncharacterized protein